MDDVMIEFQLMTKCLSMYHRDLGVDDVCDTGLPRPNNSVVKPDVEHIVLE